MKYCKKCLYPSTKPDLMFDEDGTCSACTSFEQRKSIDWDQRREEFLDIVSHIKKQTGYSYDCIVPVSGGKDSTYQILKVLEYGLKPLAVTATTCDLSNLGFRNLSNISKLGVDHIQITPNREIRKTLNKYALETVGDISWPEHTSIFTIPIRLAIEQSIPLIIWGENPQNEYGGPSRASGMKTLNTEWLQEFGGLNGLRTRDLIDKGLLDNSTSKWYRHHPQTAEYNIKGLFLGYFFEWDGYENAKIAQRNGFEFADHFVSGSGYEYENLDNHQTGIHDYFKYIKFGFGRATDLANNHLRRGRITREQAQAHIRKYDGQFPWRYLGKPLEKILDDIEMTQKEFIKCCIAYTNKDLFEVDEFGQVIPKFEVGRGLKD